MYNRLVKLILESGSKPCKACGHPAHQVRKGAKRGFKRYECGSTKVGGVAGSKCQFAWSEKPKIKAVEPEKKADSSTGVDKLKSWANKTGVKRKGIDEALSGISRAYMNANRKSRKAQKKYNNARQEYRDSQDNKFASDADKEYAEHKYAKSIDDTQNAAGKSLELKQRIPTKAKRNRERVRSIIKKHLDGGWGRSMAANVAKRTKSDLQKSQID